MDDSDTQEDVWELVESLNLAEKIERSLSLIDEACTRFGSRLVAAHSMGKDSCVLWHLAKTVDPSMRGFVVTTRFKPKATVDFMRRMVSSYPELSVYSNEEPLPDDLHRTDPDRCCELLKVRPTREALADLGAACWMTGLRCTEGDTRTVLKEWERRPDDIWKLNPILLWKEREVWQYLALHSVPVNPLYGAGYRSLGCEPCTSISTGGDERAGRWVGSKKQGGECGIHTCRMASQPPPDLPNLQNLPPLLEVGRQSAETSPYGLLTCPSCGLAGHAGISNQ